MFLYTCIWISLLSITNIGGVIEDQDNRLDDIVKNITKINEALQSFITNYKKLQNLYNSDASIDLLDFESDKEVNNPLTRPRAKTSRNKTQNEENQPAESQAEDTQLEEYSEQVTSTVKNFATEMFMSVEKEYIIDETSESTPKELKEYNPSKSEGPKLEPKQKIRTRNKNKENVQDIESKSDSEENGKEARARSRNSASGSVEKSREVDQADSVGADFQTYSTKSILLGWSNENILRIGKMLNVHMSGERLPLDEIKDLLDSHISLTNEEEKRIKSLQEKVNRIKARAQIMDQKLQMAPKVLAKKVNPSKKADLKYLLGLQSPFIKPNTLNNESDELTKSSTNKKQEENINNKSETSDDVWSPTIRPVNEKEISHGLRRASQNETKNAKKKPKGNNEGVTLPNVTNQSNISDSEMSELNEESDKEDKKKIREERANKIKSDFIRNLLRERALQEILHKNKEQVDSSWSTSSDRMNENFSKENIPILRQKYGKACLLYVVKKCFRATKHAAEEACQKVGCKKELRKSIKETAKLSCQEEYYGPRAPYPTTTSTTPAQGALPVCPVSCPQPCPNPCPLQCQLNNCMARNAINVNKTSADYDKVIEIEDDVNTPPEEVPAQPQKFDFTRRRMMDTAPDPFGFVACFPDSSIAVRRNAEEKAASKHKGSSDTSFELPPDIFNATLSSKEMKVNILRDRFERACKKESAKRCKRAAIRAMQVSCAATSCTSRFPSEFKKKAKRECDSENGVEKDSSASSVTEEDSSY